MIYVWLSFYFLENIYLALCYSCAGSLRKLMTEFFLQIKNDIQQFEFNVLFLSPAT